MILMGLNGNIMVYKWFINGNISMILILMGLNGNIMVFYIMFSLWQRPRFGCSPTLSDRDKFCCDFHRPFACKKISIKHIITYQITIQWIGRENLHRKPWDKMGGCPTYISSTSTGEITDYIRLPCSQLGGQTFHHVQFARMVPQSALHCSLQRLVSA